ncbi:transposase [Micromonospora sp. NPDC005299]|uniref:transposase n=1 Tax=Micromonospora sp. NPDC005299 TaxID=3364231 RepID=UPI0036BDDEAC
MAAPKKYPDELRQRAVRLYRESDPKPVIKRLAERLVLHPEVLRNWIRQDQADRGEREDRPTSEMAQENRRLRKEVAELRRANEILKAASAYFAPELDPTRRRSCGPSSRSRRSCSTAAGGEGHQKKRAGSGFPAAW